MMSIKARCVPRAHKSTTILEDKMDYDTMDFYDSTYGRKASIVDSAYGSFEDEIPYNVDWKFDLRRDSIEQFLYPMEYCEPIALTPEALEYKPMLEPVYYMPVMEPQTVEPMYIQEQVEQIPTPTSPKEKSCLGKKFPCHMCPSSFSRNHDLKRHMRIHLGIRPYKCQHCPKAFTRMDALHRHTTVGGCKSMK
jgi:hypothetical protein